jgi:hypothetical protein
MMSLYVPPNKSMFVIAVYAKNAGVMIRIPCPWCNK